jgi:hypothetical protein
MGTACQPAGGWAYLGLGRPSKPLAAATSCMPLPTLVPCHAERSVIRLVGRRMDEVCARGVLNDVSAPTWVRVGATRVVVIGNKCLIHVSVRLGHVPRPEVSEVVPLTSILLESLDNGLCRVTGEP